jgi:hypothetical protein
MSIGVGHRSSNAWESSQELGIEGQTIAMRTPVPRAQPGPLARDALNLLTNLGPQVGGSGWESNFEAVLTGA